MPKLFHIRQATALFQLLLLKSVNLAFDVEFTLFLRVGEVRKTGLDPHQPRTFPQKFCKLHHPNPMDRQRCEIGLRNGMRHLEKVLRAFARLNGRRIVKRHHKSRDV